MRKKIQRLNSIDPPCLLYLFQQTISLLTFFHIAFLHKQYNPTYWNISQLFCSSALYLSHSVISCIHRHSEPHLYISVTQCFSQVSLDIASDLQIVFFHMAVSLLLIFNGIHSLVVSYKMSSQVPHCCEFCLTLPLSPLFKTHDVLLNETLNHASETGTNYT